MDVETYILFCSSYLHIRPKTFTFQCKIVGKFCVPCLVYYKAVFFSNCQLSKNQKKKKQTHILDTHQSLHQLNMWIKNVINENISLMRSQLTVCILINHSLGLNPSDVLPSLHHPQAPSTNQVPYTYSTNTIEIPHKYQTYIIQILSYKRHTIQILYLCHFHPHQYSFISLPIK